jgi:glycosyltransferase involved in cell wall biosynthesis
MAARLAGTVNRLPEVEPTYVHVNTEDYAAIPAPWWARTTNPWHAEFLAPQDLELWKAAARDYRRPIKLLFAGNDFVRKGGDFLLQFYSDRLAGAWTLTIASNDPAIATRQLPKGVEWLRGRNHVQMLDVYRAHDIFLLPSRQDYMPQVLAEALATGLPCLATDVGGIRDLVRDGETGFLMPAGAPASTWAACLDGLAANPAEIRRLSTGARQFAEDRLGLNRFEDLIRKTVNLLRSGPRLNPSEGESDLPFCLQRPAKPDSLP